VPEIGFPEGWTAAYGFGTADQESVFSESYTPLRVGRSRRQSCIGGANSGTPAWRPAIQRSTYTFFESVRPSVMELGITSSRCERPSLESSRVRLYLDAVQPADVLEIFLVVVQNSNGTDEPGKPLGSGCPASQRVPPRCRTRYSYAPTFCDSICAPSSVQWLRTPGRSS